MNQTITSQAVDAVMCATTTPMGWPEAFATVGVAFALGFIIYCLGR